MIKIEGLKVSYGDYVAVDNLNLNIQSRDPNAKDIVPINIIKK